MRIGGHDTDRRVLVVAEIGNNHEGDPDAARRLVAAAAEAGCDAAKLQVFHAGTFVRPADEARRRQMERFQLADEVVVELLRTIRRLGMAAVATPLDLPAVDLLEPHVDALKIASGDNDHVPLLRRAAAGSRPLIVSSGLSDEPLVRRAADLVRAERDGRPDRNDLAVLHCVSAYPAPPEAANLAAIAPMARRLGCTAGYSDHTLGIEVAALAVAAGARIVEKHFTLDTAASDFRDHALSADPAAMAELVQRVRRAEAALGSPRKAVQPAEESLLAAARRSIVAARDLPAGHLLEPADLGWMRPRDGLAPGSESQVLGLRTRDPVPAGTALRPEELT